MDYWNGGLLEIRCEYDCQHHHKGGGYRYSQPLGRSHVDTDLYFQVSVPYLYFVIVSLSNWDYESVSPNRKLI